MTAPHDAVFPWRAFLAAALLPACFLAPLLGKPFDVDGPLFVWTAQHVSGHPLDFYGFQAHWKHTFQPAHEVMQNPPMLAYVLAPLGALSGWQEAALHAAMLLLAMAASSGVFALARLFCGKPLLAAALAVCAPGFLVSASNIMADVPLVAAWTWALYCWVRGSRENRPRLLLLAVCLAALAGLTKYFGIALLPLMGAYSLALGQGRKRHLLYLLLPAAVFGLYECHTYFAYGRGLITDAGAFVAGFERETPWGWPGKVLTMFVFLGASIPGAALLMGIHHRRAGQAAAMAVVVLLWLQLFLPGPELFPPRHEWVPFLEARQVFWRSGQGAWNASFWVRLQWAALLPAGVLAAVLPVHHWWKNRDPASLLLMLWVGGTCFFAAVLYHMINVRVLLPLFPAAAIVAVRIMEGSGRPWAPLWRSGRALALGLAVVLGVLGLAAAYRQAGIQKQAAQDVHARYGDAGALWFTGHFGFQYYMQALGGRPLDRARPEDVQLGDYVVLPSNTAWPLFPRPEAVETEEVLRYEPFPWFTLMSYHRHSGFYADTMGALPYAIQPAHPEEYAVFRVVDTPVLRSPPE